MVILLQFQSEGDSFMQNDLWNQYSMYSIRSDEKKALGKAYNKIGLSLLVYFILSVAISFLYAFLFYVPVISDFLKSETGENLFSTVINVFCMVIPFFLLRSKKSHYHAPTVKPLKLSSTLKYLSLGFGAFYVSNFVSNLFMNICAAVGITLSQPDFSLPSSPVAAFIFFLQMTLGAGIFEELLFRGAVLGNLRRFGDKTAILASAFLFAAFHGNLIQAPFAFVLGLYLGYVACKTDNIVYAILIHATNNGVAVLLTFLSSVLNEQIYTFIGIIYAAISMLFGIIGLVLELLTASKELPLKKEEGILTIPQKFGRLFASPSVIVLLLLCLFITASYVQFGPVAN